MPYVGNSPTSNFASVTKDAFSGDGSTTAFTLSKAATTNGVAVFVENVRQEPTTAYAVSGTTLTFTAAPVSASGNNIYVLHHNSPASTATHPAAQPLTATSGTFTTNIDVDGTANLDVVDIDGAVDISGVTALTNKLTVLASDGTVDNEFVVDIRNDEQTDDRSFGLRLAAGSTTTDRVLDVQNHAMDKVYLRVDGAGHVTMSNQPMYRAVLANRMSLSGSAETQVTDITENFDVGNNASSGTFTCPIAGKYLATFSGSYRSDGASYVDASIKQNTTYRARGYSELSNAAQVRGANAWHPFGMSALLECSASDTIKFFFGAGAGASQLLETPYTVMQVKLVG